ncbi:hypothetical protein HME9304_02722 [Flagellimonas maritima]|uniref:Copper chaperone NosL n=2 Tax=Flagellimonas maritima TaxID=1383885 RepID=A0A2Z4LUW1_9FLAO|nr:hypothetical protein HME9304_02722 [Allomuricauda aurantiaca]
MSLSLMLVAACSVGPKPIAYGDAGCHYCKMTIVDKQHAAQMVTKKGKVFNFDATECMLNHLKEIDQEIVKLMLTNDYNAPGKLIAVTEATFLISKAIPSPMGEYLTAFATKDEARAVLEKHGDGELFTWQQLKQRFK